MQQRFRLVVLDYPKLHLQNEAVKQALSDLIQCKQIQFERASETYITLNAHDMIATHFLIYDITHLYEPRLVVAIRNCYERRAKKHGLKLPSEIYIETAPPELRAKFNDFRSKKDGLVDCNAWFVDPDYTYTATQLPLSDIAYFALVSFTLRKGYDHFVGATNERFKASRWVAQIGTFEQDLIFEHPEVRSPHKLLLIQKFSDEWLKRCYTNYKQIIDSSYEILPDPKLSNETLRPHAQILAEVDQRLEEASQRQSLREVDRIMTSTASI